MDKYEEALEKARAEYEKAREQGYTWLMGLLEGMFPDLKESEDERIRKAIMEVLKRVSGATDVLENQGTTFKKAMIWLEKQKESTWTKEDENMRDNILRFLGCFVGTSECDSNPSLSVPYPAYQREMAWLKSLRHQSYWKPSGEQMEALNEAIGDFRMEDTASCEKTADTLQSLYNDLKKL